MLAVKATYDNGTVRWRERPSIAGRHELIVVFEDVETPTEESPAYGTKPKESDASWQAFKGLVGCVAERTDGSEGHDLYLAGTKVP